RHVITANKELMAKHGAELLAIAEEHGVHLLFEASVAGGIPVIRMLQGYLTANRVSEISGILNGTCNYILTEMAKTGREYADILADAIELGYAESDPTSDVEGYDAAYKLAILTNLAYEAHVPVEAIERQGISRLHAADLRCADRFGCAIKLIGAAREGQDGVMLSVRPRLLPKEHPLARIDDVFNAVTIQANVVGELTFSGRGAGEFPTASAVLEDLTVLLTGSNALRRPTWHRPLAVAAPAPAPDGGFYVSFNCPSNISQADAVTIAAGYAAAVYRAGGRIVNHALEETAGGILRQAWLIAGVAEESVQKTLLSLARSDAHALSAVILPVDVLSTLGVEWEADQGWYEETASAMQAQAL
ncbi:MAG: homoserine dehydrogenase, partial [Tumebacillaceae bacterium]